MLSTEQTDDHSFFYFSNPFILVVCDEIDLRGTPIASEEITLSGAHI